MGVRTPRGVRGDTRCELLADVTAVHAGALLLTAVPWVYRLVFKGLALPSNYPDLYVLWKKLKK